MVVSCQICGKQFESFRGLNGHMNAHIPSHLKRAESYKPPSSAVKAAKKGLAQRKEWGRGGLSPSEAKSQGIDSGVTRARKISSGSVSRHDVRRMSAFNRHRKNNRPDKKMPDGGPTAGTIAWNLWGGTSGVNWAKKKSAAMNAESFEAPKICLECNKEWEYDSRDKSHSNFCHDCSPRPETFDAENDKNLQFDDVSELMDIDCPFCSFNDLRLNHLGYLHLPTWSQREKYNWTIKCGPCGEEWDKDGNSRHSTQVSAETLDAETLDYNSFTNDMEALLFKYSQMVMHYDTEYQSKARGGDGVMKMSVSFIPSDAYFDDVDFDAEEGQLAKALAAVREKSKRYAPTPLRLTKLPHPDQKTLRDFEADWRDLSRDNSGRWLPAGENQLPDDSTVSFDRTDMSWMTPSEYYEYILEEPLDISDDIEDDTQTIEFQERLVRYTAMTMLPQVIEDLIEENKLEIVSDLFADPSEAEGEIAFLKAVSRYQKLSEQWSAE